MVREISEPVLRGAALAASLVAIALLAGCGGDDDESPAGTGAQTGAATAQTGGGPSPEDFGEEAGPEDSGAAGSSVQDFLRALADEDAAKACSLMSASVKENLELFLEGAARKEEKNTCAELVEELTKQIPAGRLPQADRIEVTGLRIESDRGFVLYRDDDGNQWAFPVVREESAWKVAAIVGSKRQ